MDSRDPSPTPLNYAAPQEPDADLAARRRKLSAQLIFAALTAVGWAAITYLGGPSDRPTTFSILAATLALCALLLAVLSLATFIRSFFH